MNQSRKEKASMIVERTFTVGIQDIGANYEITNRALIEALCNIANLHGTLAGHGLLDREKHQLAWVVSGWKAEILKRPRMGESYTIRTWSRCYEKITAYRDFEIFSADEPGEMLGRATSEWMCLNLQRGRLVRLTPEIMDPYRPEPDRISLPDAVFTDPRDLLVSVRRSLPFHVLRCMIDCNQHVHNAAYLDMAREVLPEDMDQRHFSRIEILYKKEIRPGDTVLLEYGRESEDSQDSQESQNRQVQGKHYVMIRSQEDSTLHAAIILE